MEWLGGLSKIHSYLLLGTNVPSLCSKVLPLYSNIASWVVWAKYIASYIAISVKKAIPLMYGNYVAPTLHWVVDTSKLMEVHQIFLCGELILKAITPLHEKRSGHARLAASLVHFVLQKCMQEGDLYCIMQECLGSLSRIYGYLWGRQFSWCMALSYVAWRSYMFERSCLFLNIEALYINSPVPPCDYRRKCTETMPIFAYVSFYKNILKKGHVKCIFANLIA